MNHETSNVETKDVREQESEPKPRRRSAPWLLGGLVLVLLSVLVALQVFGLWEVVTPDTATETLSLYALSSLNFVAFFIFTFIFVRSLLKLRRERRERQLGSKIKTRLIVYFIAVSLLPITGMALFSYIFLNRSLEKWFSRLPEDVVREARLAHREEADEQAKSVREVAAAIAVALNHQLAETNAEARVESDTVPEIDLKPFVESGELTALAIISADGDVTARSNVTALEAARQSEFDKAFEDARRQVTQNSNARPISSGTFIFVFLPLQGERTLIAARERRSNSHLGKIIAGSEAWDELRNKQKRVRLLGLSTLGLLTLMLLFAATWSAIHLARGIATPIRALAEAADKVAGGDLEHRVTAIADDELALLAESFNQMTAQLGENRRRIEAGATELREKNLALAERRDYIETILESLSTGVVSLDARDRVTTINAAALAMLSPGSAPPIGIPIDEILGAEDRAVLDRVLWRARLRGRAAEHVELARAAAVKGDSENISGNGNNGGGGGVVPVALTATALGQRDDEGRGVVLVMEDLSELLAAQRAAAWSEVAQRMAHEIKNPLTPIQLSAERIARSFLRSAGDGNSGTSTALNQSSTGAHAGGKTDREHVACVVEECTTTITREVAGLKAMVDEFTRFARMPHARLELADLNEVVRQAVALYEDRLGEARMDVRLAHTLPGAMLDAEQLRRLFVNLIDNSLEALQESADGERRITVATGYDPARGQLLAEVADTGHGIARTNYSRLFQPYFSTRGRGTGLGLAIVQRIITEHGGRIRAEANHPRGARFIVELPVAEDAKTNDERGMMNDESQSKQLSSRSSFRIHHSSFQ